MKRKQSVLTFPCKVLKHDLDLQPEVQEAVDLWPPPAGPAHDWLIQISSWAWASQYASVSEDQEWLLLGEKAFAYCAGRWLTEPGRCAADFQAAFLWWRCVWQHWTMVGGILPEGLSHERMLHCWWLFDLDKSGKARLTWGVLLQGHLGNFWKDEPAAWSAVNVALFVSGAWKKFYLRLIEELVAQRLQARPKGISHPGQNFYQDRHEGQLPEGLVPIEPCGDVGMLVGGWSRA